MARRVVTQLISDISGEEIAEGSGETVEFSYKGVDYVIDLTDKEAATFDASVASYLERATRTGGRRVKASTKRGTSGSHSAKDVRAWAVRQGLDVPLRGRIPQSILDQYRAAS